MKKILFIAFVICTFLPTAVLAQNDENTEQRISIVNPYAFATMPGATTGAAFMRIVNKGSEDDMLMSAKATFTKKTELHKNFIDPDDGEMMMRRIKRIEVPKDGDVLLDPKGYHVMFIKLKEPLILDTNIEVTLKFKKSGIYRVNIPVVQPGMIPQEVEAEDEKSAEENHEEWPPRYRGDDEDKSNPVYKKIK